MKKETCYPDTDVKRTNRDKSLTPRKAKFWCYHCDHQLVGEYSKCPYCGTKNNRKRFKTE